MTGRRHCTWADGTGGHTPATDSRGQTISGVTEDNASVLEPFAGNSEYSHHGQRVVIGQRLMQPASDLFLGWVTGPEGRHFYLRQLRDVKVRILVETYDAEMLSIYGRACGWVVAITGIAVRHGLMPGGQGAALVGGGILTVILFPALASRFLREPPVPADIPQPDRLRMTR